MKQLEFIAKGRVQGVMFRKNIRKFAKKNNLQGFVKNNEDGSVKGIIQGTENNLKSFLSWIKSNPGFSKINIFETKSVKIKNQFKDFKIIKDDSFFVDKYKSVKNLFKSHSRNNKIPQHIVIIPDGNRRWAKRRGLVSFKGHQKAGEFNNMLSLFAEARNLGVKYFSIWGFSTENWKRSKKEIDVLFDIFYKSFENFRKEAHKNKIRFRHLGRKDRFPKKLTKKLEELERETKNYHDYNVQLCLDYGGRDEIIRSINKVLKSGKKKITEENFIEFLDSHAIPDPDLIIRTSGEKRISGFMPYQATYAELSFVKKNFPSFTAKDLRKIILNFGKRNRRFGGN